MSKYYLIETTQAKMFKHKIILGAPTKEDIIQGLNSAKSASVFTKIISSFTGCHAMTNSYEILKEIDIIDPCYVYIPYSIWNGKS